VIQVGTQATAACADEPAATFQLLRSGYALHDLVRLFARERLRDEEEATLPAQLRMTDWLLRSASAAGRRFEAPGAPEPWPGEPDAFTPGSTDEAEE
jgi:hypothetical protein